MTPDPSRLVAQATSVGGSIAAFYVQFQNLIKSVLGLHMWLLHSKP